MTSKKGIFITPFLILLLITPLPAQRTKSSLNAGEQRHAEKGLKDNKYFFAFINTTTSNTGTAEEIQLFTESAKRDLIARVLYMKFAFHGSFTEIKKSQELLIDLFRKSITRETEDSRKLLNELAPEILKFKDPFAKKYLSLGYRSSRLSEKVMIMSDNLPENNYSIRLYEYVRALKLAKYAKRYALISIIESRLEPYKKRKTSYNRYNVMIELINTYLPDQKERFSMIHKDNFYKILSEPSLYDRIMQKPELETIPEYEQYMKEN